MSELWRAQRRLIITTSALFAVFLLITLQVVWDGPLRTVDANLANSSWYDEHPLSMKIASYVDHLGLRGVTAAILLGVAALIWYLNKQPRPMILAVLSLLGLNLVVGALKLLIGRTKPRLGIDVIDAGGMSYPSGHSANAILTWGLIAYLLVQYSRRARKRAGRLVTIVISITIAVISVSIFRNTHWFTDLLGGAFIGATLLSALITIDRHHLQEHPIKELVDDRN